MLGERKFEIEGSNSRPEEMIEAITEELKRFV